MTINAQSVGGAETINAAQVNGATSINAANVGGATTIAQLQGATAQAIAGIQGATTTQVAQLQGQTAQAVAGIQSTTALGLGAQTLQLGLTTANDQLQATQSNNATALATTQSNNATQVSIDAANNNASSMQTFMNTIYPLEAHYGQGFIATNITPDASGAITATSAVGAPVPGTPTWYASTGYPPGTGSSNVPWNPANPFALPAAAAPQPAAPASIFAGPNVDPFAAFFSRPAQSADVMTSMGGDRGSGN